MTKSELIEMIARKQKHLPAKDVELAVKHLLDLMSDSLARGERIEIRGFGSFSLHYRPPRMGRNPKTGEPVVLPTEVAAELRARNVRFVDCQLDGAWLRSAILDRCAFEDCDLSAADLLGARLTDVRFVGCRLDEAELSSARTEGKVALHGSTFAGARGLQALRNLVIAHDQALPLALPLLAANGITVDDTYLDPPPR